MSATDATHVDQFAPPLLTAGDVVAERYRVKALLGEGGMGVVYRVEHTHLRKHYAMKVLRVEWSSSREILARFEREAIAAGRIQSPHVVAATDFGRLADGSFFLVMEHVKGRTLRGVLEAGALEVPRALHILRGIVAALGAAHAEGIVHRDVKPENVMLVERDGDADFVKVLDFGLAKADGLTGAAPASGTTALTQAGVIMGTLAYMSPEQACAQQVDARSDLYSAGVVLFEMLTGKCPFRGGAGTMWRQHVVGDVPQLPVDVAARVGAGLSAVLARMLATVPGDRFRNAAELVAALDACTSEARRTPPVPPPSQPRSAQGTSSPVAVRLRDLALSALESVRRAANEMLSHRPALLRSVTRTRESIRRALANRRALLGHVTRRRLIVGLLVVAAVTTIAVVLFSGGEPSKETSHAALRPGDSVVVATPNARSTPVSDPAIAASDVPLVNLPPPPAPPTDEPPRR
jgi:serine/threonine-protein kinase